MNMDVTLDAKRVVAPPWLPVQALAFRVMIQDGNAVAKPLTMRVQGGGAIAGELTIDARADNPRVRANLVLTDIELKNFFREVALLRHYAGQSARPCRARRQRPLARAGDGLSRWPRGFCFWRWFGQ